jgi:class 3 adenylate cyclase
VLTCASCTHENNDVAKFCEECGAKLASTPVREERKVITALFCDLVGSTALGESMDHEDVARLLGTYQALCRARIESRWSLRRIRS